MQPSAFPQSKRGARCAGRASRVWIQLSEIDDLKRYLSILELDTCILYLTSESARFHGLNASYEVRQVECERQRKCEGRYATQDTVNRAKEAARRSERKSLVNNLVNVRQIK